MVHEMLHSQNPERSFPRMADLFIWVVRMRALALLLDHPCLCQFSRQSTSYVKCMQYYKLQMTCVVDLHPRSLAYHVIRVMSLTSLLICKGLLSRKPDSKIFNTITVLMITILHAHCAEAACFRESLMWMCLINFDSSTGCLVRCL